MRQCLISCRPNQNAPEEILRGVGFRAGRCSVRSRFLQRLQPDFGEGQGGLGRLLRFRRDRGFQGFQGGGVVLVDLGQ